MKSVKRVFRVVSLALTGALLFGAFPVSGAWASEYRRIHFPVAGPSSYGDDFGDVRSGGRTHEGNDIFGAKLQPLLSAVDGKVSFLRADSTGLSGNMLTITDSEGWQYRYIHINNDSPGTDDGANPPEWTLTPEVFLGARVSKGQHIAYLGDSGNAESTAPHLHFEINRPDKTPINPWTSLRLAQGLHAGNRCAYDETPKGNASQSSGAGYWAMGADGGIFSFGDAAFHGSTGGMRLNQQLVGMAGTPSGNGYWLVASDGGIFSFGDAQFFGSTGDISLAKPIIGMASTPSGNGYWLFAADGGIFSFGDAQFFGSTGSMTLNRPIVGMAPTSTGKGYWMVASDGGVFSFGDAAFFGSTGNIVLAKPIAAMAPAPKDKGYWMVASDGGVFAFGGAAYHGSLPAVGLCTWPEAVSIEPTSSGEGYWVQAKDGSTWTFGDAWYYGGVNALGLLQFAPTIDFAVLPAS
ncbi:MAG: M23 family metallopeptidase [Actinobacteria bacterium]|nr:M23 family metallopeptidase [Actinomycetota bacterium]